jgi:ABC-type multidrug transport system fused ATPase/permease subunit
LPQLQDGWRVPRVATPVRGSACLDTALPGIRGDRLAAEAVVGVTVHAGGRGCAAGPASARCVAAMNVVEASGLGKRYGGTWALRECSVAVPAGHAAALAGPNGAGKTTLLNLAAGLAAPTAGAVTVLGGRPPGSPAALDGIAFVAQDTPLYKNLPAADMLRLALPWLLAAMAV